MSKDILRSGKLTNRHGKSAYDPGKYHKKSVDFPGSDMLVYRRLPFFLGLLWKQMLLEVHQIEARYTEHNVMNLAILTFTKKSVDYSGSCKGW